MLQHSQVAQLLQNVHDESDLDISKALIRSHHYLCARVHDGGYVFPVNLEIQILQARLALQEIPVIPGLDVAKMLEGRARIADMIEVLNRI